MLEPLPQSVVGALIDLVEDLPAVTGGGPLAGPTPPPVKLTLGQDACGISEQDAVLNRFPFQLLVRLVERRTTPVNRVFVPSGPSSRAGSPSARRASSCRPGTRPSSWATCSTWRSELALLYAPAAIARSALASFTGWVWDRSAFAAPG